MKGRSFQFLLQKLMNRMLKPRTIPTFSGQGNDLKAQSLFESMSDEEKLDYISGVDSFCIKGIKRLGLSPIWTSDATSGPRGHKADVTIFPSAIALSATFNDSLVYQVAQCIGEEARALGISILLAPGVNIARIPNCGRAFEYMGEDPYLTGRIASGYVKGVQSKGVATTVKHFACNNSEYNRHKDNAVIDERTLQTIYLPAFKAAIDAGSLGVMCSYILNHGVHSSQSEHLRNILDSWGFKGFFISDWTSLYDTVKAVRHGVDLEMPKGVYFSKKRLRKALDEGLITMSQIDDKVKRILGAMEAIGALNRPMVDPDSHLSCPEHAKVALQSALESITLLKNDKALLPLRRPKSIVIAGKLASHTPTGGGGSSFIIAQKPVMDLVDSLTNTYPDSKVSYIPSHFKKHSRLIEEADAVIYVAGYDNSYESEAYDRLWTLPKGQDKDLCELHKINENIVSVIHSGGALDTSGLIEYSRSILWAYYLGEQSSQALGLIINGEISPSGRLPFSVAKNLEDYKSYLNMGVNNQDFSLGRVLGSQGRPKGQKKLFDNAYDEGQEVGYRQFDAQGTDLAFYFGQGLSYTSFSLQDSSLSGDDSSLTIRATVTNTGEQEAKTPVLAYVKRPRQKRFVAIKDLKGFTKVSLKPGSKASVEINIPYSSLEDYNEDTGSWFLDKGLYEVLLGFTSLNLQSLGSVSL